VARLAQGNAWFQIYTPKEPEVLTDMMATATSAGIDTLVVTVDVPVGSRRERQVAAGLTVPPRLDALTLWRVARRPAWALATLSHGRPRFRTLEQWFPAVALAEGAKIVGSVVDGRPDWDTFARIRDAWGGKLVLKGLLRPEEALRAETIGADAIVVSNHGGRQFDAAPAAIEALPAVAEAVSGRVPILFDSGIRGGLDIMRAIALGADFCLLGRGFVWAVAALGHPGARHAHDILRADLENNMIQLGVRTLGDLRGRAKWHASFEVTAP